jgi:hypothetical protein
VSVKASDEKYFTNRHWFILYILPLAILRILLGFSNQTGYAGSQAAGYEGFEIVKSFVLVALTLFPPYVDSAVLQ